jgi:hypothetical protein
MEQTKDLYYTLAGWDAATGCPALKILEFSGLAWMINNLQSTS